MHCCVLRAKTCLLVLAIAVAVPTSVPAQFASKFVDHVKNASPRTVHTMVELDFFPSVTEENKALPVFRFDLNFVEAPKEREVRRPYYHSAWGNAVGWGGPGVLAIEEFISAGISYRVLEQVETSLTWEPIGYWVNPNQGVFGSGLTAQIALPLVVLEVNERAQGMGFGFVTQDGGNMRIRNVKVRLNVTPGLYLSFSRQGILAGEGGLSSVALGLGF